MFDTDFLGFFAFNSGGNVDKGFESFCTVLYAQLEGADIFQTINARL